MTEPTYRLLLEQFDATTGLKFSSGIIERGDSVANLMKRSGGGKRLVGVNPPQTEEFRVVGPAPYGHILERITELGPSA